MFESYNIDRRFAGIKRLYGEKAYQVISKAHICVIGIGGVGSWAAEALARSGVTAITLIDMDVIAESNVNRQIHALTGEFGKAKIIAMKERIIAINPECQVATIDDFVTLENYAHILNATYDYIIDCTDDYRTKAAMIAYCKRLKIRIITVGGAGGMKDPTKILLADLSRTEQDPLLAKTRKLLRQDYRFSHNPKRRFEIPAVYSTEQITYSAADGETCYEKSKAITTSGLSCTGGLGSAMMVTAVFGLVSVSYVLNKLSQKANA